jgi:mannitol/fructose-specific phosphotransferase system IIA component (Ntr-type)
MITPNPFIADIKRDYPLVFRCAWMSIQDSYYLKELLNEDEVGYLTLYLVLALNRLYSPISKQIRVFIVCNSGKATALLLESRIKAEFRDVVIVGITSYLELLNHQYQDECDLVISTIPIQLKNVPVVTVSPFLSSEDLSKLKTILTSGNIGNLSDRAEKFTVSGKLQLADLLTKRTVRLKEHAFTWQEVVDKAGSILLSIGAITFKYIQEIKSTIELHGPYMVIWPGVALLHAIPGKSVLKPCMSLITLKKPVAFGHKSNDPVDIAIVLGPVDNQIHVPALISLVDMMKEQKAVQGLRSATRIDDALKVISRFSHDQIDAIETQ